MGQKRIHLPLLPRLEVQDLPLAVLGDGDAGYGYARLIQNWSRDLALVTGGQTTLTDEQLDDLNAKRHRYYRG